MARYALLTGPRWKEFPQPSSRRLSRPTTSSAAIRQFVEPPLPPLLLDPGERLTIHTRRAARSAAQRIDVAQHVPPVDLVVQEIETEPDFLLRFHMWCLAKLLDRYRRGQTQSVNRLVARSCQHRSRTKGPSLHQHYPASPVLRPYPPPQGAGSVPHDTTVGQHRLPAAPRGFPYCTQPLFRTCRRHYPGGTVGCSTSFASPNGGGLPRNSGGSASALPLSRPAQRSLHVTACALAKSLTDPLHQKLRPIRYLHGRSDCYRLERLLPGGIRTH